MELRSVENVKWKKSFAVDSKLKDKLKTFNTLLLISKEGFFLIIFKIVMCSNNYRKAINSTNLTKQPTFISAMHMMIVDRKTAIRLKVIWMTWLQNHNIYQNSGCHNAPVICNLRSPHPGRAGIFTFCLCETKWIPR